MELTIDEINNLVKNNETLINKNNRLEEELNQTKLLLEGKNTEHNALITQLVNHQEEIIKYLTVFKEIGEIVRKICDRDCSYTAEHPCGDNDCYYYQILTKISEVIK